MSTKLQTSFNKIRNLGSLPNFDEKNRKINEKYA